MGTYAEKDVICPFYKHEKGLRIRCEGFCPSCDLMTVFRDREDFCRHKEKHCNSFEGYPKCPLYAVIIRQYE